MEIKYYDSWVICGMIYIISIPQNVLMCITAVYQKSSYSVCFVSFHYSFFICSLLSTIRSPRIVSIKWPWLLFPAFLTCSLTQFFSIKVAIYARPPNDRELLCWSFLILTTLYAREVFVNFNKNSDFITLVSPRLASLQKQIPREAAQLSESSTSVAMVLI